MLLTVVSLPASESMIAQASSVELWVFCHKLNHTRPNHICWISLRPSDWQFVVLLKQVVMVALMFIIMDIVSVEYNCIHRLITQGGSHWKSPENPTFQERKFLMNESVSYEVMLTRIKGKGPVALGSTDFFAEYTWSLSSDLNIRLY